MRCLYFGSSRLVEGEVRGNGGEKSGCSQVSYLKSIGGFLTQIHFVMGSSCIGKLVCFLDTVDQLKRWWLKGTEIIVIYFTNESTSVPVRVLCENLCLKEKIINLQILMLSKFDLIVQIKVFASWLHYVNISVILFKLTGN